MFEAIMFLFLIILIFIIFISSLEIPKSEKDKKKLDNLKEELNLTKKEILKTVEIRQEEEKKIEKVDLNVLSKYNEQKTNYTFKEIKNINQKSRNNKRTNKEKKINSGLTNKTVNKEKKINTSLTNKTVNKEKKINTSLTNKIINNGISFDEEYKYFNDIKNNYNYNYFIKYYPKRYEVNYEDNNNRYIIYDFKNGERNEYYSNWISSFIYKKYKNKTNIVILPIPASTEYKNKIRFYYLLEKISEKTGIINGYSFINIINDREAAHLVLKEINSVNYIIDYEKIKDKHIIILDDIITRGNGFVELANKLKMNGAKTIEGLFLGKTQSNYDYVKGYNSYSHI